MIQLAASEPNSDAVALFPEAARANRSVFYDRQGKQVFDHVGPYSSAASLERDIRSYVLR